MSEIRTLRDGDIDILPRTVASAVQTADGSTVEDKINSAGGAKKLILNLTLTSNWTGATAPYTQMVVAEGITSNDYPHITPIFSEDINTAKNEQLAWNLIDKAVANNGNIVFTCFDNKPAININLLIEVIQ